MVAELATCEDEYPIEEPLAFTIAWTGERFDARCGPRDAPDAALASVKPGSEWDNPRAPETLEVYAERGVAVLTGWSLAVAE